MAVSQISVGLAEIKIAKDEGNLIAFGLGSCIGLIAYCRRTHIAGMVHIMLPEAFKDRPVDKPGKFADTGVPELLKAMKSAGSGSNLVYAYAGGAQVFQFGGTSPGLEIGSKNIVAVEKQMRLLLARPLAIEVGGNVGRTFSCDVATGDVMIKTVQGGSSKLTNLRAA